MPVEPEASPLTSTNGATRKKRRVRKFAPARRQGDEAAEFELRLAGDLRLADEVPAWVAPSSLTNGAKGATEAPKDPQDMSIGELKMRLTSLGVDPAGYIEKGEMVSALQAKLAEIE